MNKKIEISILGCGWLGFPLAKHLISMGFKVKGSTTDLNKLDLFRRENIVPFLVHFKNESTPDLGDFLHSEILIIAIPPGRTEEKHIAYRSMISLIMKNHGSLKKIILISSTSVYSENNTIVDESDEPNSKSASGKLLIEAEQSLSSLEHIQVIIARPSGLIGPKRHPSRFFAGKAGIPNGQAPVNMVHQDDVISILNLLITSEHAVGSYNISSTHHPEKMEFYTHAAIQADLELPVFLNELTEWKVIESKRIMQELQFSYKFNNLYEALAYC